MRDGSSQNSRGNGMQFTAGIWNGEGHFSNRCRGMEVRVVGCWFERGRRDDLIAIKGKLPKVRRKEEEGRHGDLELIL